MSQQKLLGIGTFALSYRMTFYTLISSLKLKNNRYVTNTFLRSKCTMERR